MLDIIQTVDFAIYLGERRNDSVMVGLQDQ
jgi:hypothetical protein